MTDRQKQIAAVLRASSENLPGAAEEVEEREGGAPADATRADDV
jgi:hypothetical protein